MLYVAGWTGCREEPYKPSLLHEKKDPQGNFPVILRQPQTAQPAPALPLTSDGTI